MVSISSVVGKELKLIAVLPPYPAATLNFIENATVESGKEAPFKVGSVHRNPAFPWAVSKSEVVTLPIPLTKPAYFMIE